MSPEELKDDLNRTRERLLRAISGVTEEQFKRRPSAGEGEAAWSIAEILAHLLQNHRLRAGRIALALEKDGAEIEPSTPAAHDEGARVGRSAPVPQLIHGLLAVRREIELLIDRAAKEDGMERAVVHPVYGRQSVASMIKDRVIEHERDHVVQIEALRETIGALPAGRNV